ncbi:hypothetical protein [Lactobacillus xujianguonis]|uniref:hypothetical protein n=1 Tax=Lactobacillus xujianguonis TaxID=2495899 RepID=UPI000FD9C55D|nr:hypothetical protein [Lactobacillus xujianguonis]RVU73510.1 hypothetical protein EJK20_07700 [Lactobacillus xujianguonis]
MASNALSYLKKKLETKEGNMLSAKGYEVLFDSHMITTKQQADTLTEILVDINTSSYQAGYNDGRADQAYEDGKKMGQVLRDAD